MPKFKIFSGLGGGFGGAKEHDEIMEFDNEEEAELFAYQEASEEYEGFNGLYGLRTVEEIMNEDGVNEEEAEETYNEEKEDWLDFWVEEVEEIKDSE